MNAHVAAYHDMEQEPLTLQYLHETSPMEIAALLTTIDKDFGPRLLRVFLSVTIEDEYIDLSVHKLPGPEREWLMAWMDGGNGLSKTVRDKSLADVMISEMVRLRQERLDKASS